MNLLEIKYKTDGIIHYEPVTSGSIEAGQAGADEAGGTVAVGLLARFREAEANRNKEKVEKA